MSKIMFFKGEVGIEKSIAAKYSNLCMKGLYVALPEQFTLKDLGDLHLWMNSCNGLRTRYYYYNLLKKKLNL